jgi:hypothetical protein
MAPRTRKAARPTPRDGKGLAGIPEWEAMKAVRRNLSHADAVRECAHLTSQYRRRRPVMSKIMVELDTVIRAMNDKKVPFVLTGAHGISGWTGRPRSTHDIDILVKGGRNYARAVKVIRTLYPELEARRFAGMTGVLSAGRKGVGRGRDVPAPARQRRDVAHRRLGRGAQAALSHPEP